MFYRTKYIQEIQLFTETYTQFQINISRIKVIQTLVFQLLPSSGVNDPVIRRTISTIHQIPTPPNVSNFPTAVPVCPKQNLSIPRNPSSIL